MFRLACRRQAYEPLFKLEFGIEVFHKDGSMFVREDRRPVDIRAFLFGYQDLPGVVETV